jgi:DNA-binding NtrC family response regulator
MCLQIISPFEQDHRLLGAILTRLSWPAHGSRNFAEGIRHLRICRPAVVVCETDLPDGHWQAVLDAAEELPEPAILIVTSRFADESLWTEVLHRGGYDVLAKPFDRLEVTRVLGLARQHWLNRRGTASRDRKRRPLNSSHASPPIPLRCP